MKHVAKLAASWAVDVVLPAKYANALAEALAADRAELEAMALEWEQRKRNATHNATVAETYSRGSNLADANRAEAACYSACAARIRKLLECNDA